MAHSYVVSNECTHVADESSVVGCERTPLIFSSDIHRINHITYSLERHDYFLNPFDEISDVDMDPKDHYGMMADSLVESPEPQANLSQKLSLVISHRVKKSLNP